MTCPSEKAFTIQILNKDFGAEKIVIHPDKAKGLQYE
jgi:hypothetical protein